MYKQLSIAAVLASGMMFGSAANANENGLESLVSNLVAESMAQLKVELRESLTVDILTASYNLGKDDKVMVASRVKIRDIKEESDEKQQKSE